MPLDESHDPARRSFAAAANAQGCDFPLQNLPFGVVVAAGSAPRMAYLADRADRTRGGLDIEVEMQLQSAAMRERGLPPLPLSRASYRGAYWTLGQIVTHHSSNGCNPRPGKLLGSGTISGSTADAVGSLMELTAGGRSPLALPGGETRAFLEDGDLLVQRGRCARDGAAAIGFGAATALLLPAGGG